MLFSKVTLAVILLCMLGCSTAGNSILLNGATTLPPTKSETIKMLSAEPDQPHLIIAFVEGVAATDDYFSRSATHDAALKAMKKEAARIGAEAIIIETSGSQTYGGIFEKIHLKGKALVYSPSK